MLGLFIKFLFEQLLIFQKDLVVVDENTAVKIKCLVKYSKKISESCNMNAKQP